ncbi:Uncharacterized protein APZ42_009123 [Daphnia magna]|uniref:Uncharacterized protein n=1 Tax=Daphnia magna TaxID=35525 RepID=A0A164E7A9_9CRUS|nr:Uncharacterized protein APZ42_009123 [Daphnia magna]
MDSNLSAFELLYSHVRRKGGAITCSSVKGNESVGHHSRHPFSWNNILGSESVHG